MIIANVKSFRFRVKHGMTRWFGISIKGISPRTFSYHSHIFYCHSRECGNPEFRFRVKCGMTRKTMSPCT